MANVHYIPVHWQPIYQKRGFGPGEYPQAEKYYREAVSLPVYPGLSKEDQERVIQAVKSALQ
jgi:dTDP-4-amino-4,6-dideoxygalactose transaminase